MLLVGFFKAFLFSVLNISAKLWLFSVSVCLFVCLGFFFFGGGGDFFNVWEAGCSKVEMGRGNIFLFELCYSEWLLGWLLALVDFVVLLVCRPDQSVLFTHLGV